MVSLHAAVFLPSRTLRGVLLIAMTAAVCLAQSDLKLDAGRKLAIGLALEQGADAKTFEALGFDTAQTLLMAVVDQGQQKAASVQDWANLHRGLTGLVELFVAKDELYKAGLYASLQDGFYRNLDQNYTLALAASRLQLDLQQRSGISGGMQFAHSAIGSDLVSLGRTEEALAEFKIAHALETDPLDKGAAIRWRDIVQAETALGRVTEAREESDRFSRRALAAPPLFQARAWLAESDVEMAEGHFQAVVAAVNRAIQAVSDPQDRQGIEIDATYQMLACVLLSLNTLPYNDALQLAERIDRESSGLKISAAPFARGAILARRRLAGDLEGALAQDYQRLEQARKAADVPGQIEAQRSLAGTYSWMHANSQQIGVLEEAIALERSILPADGVPQEYPAAFSYLTTLNALGWAYADTGEVGKSRLAFNAATKAAQSIPGAAMRQRLDSLFSDSRLGKARVAELEDDPDSARDILDSEVKSHPQNSSALLQWARLERVEKPARAVQLYTSLIDVFAAGQEPRNAVTVRLELSRFLATDGQARIPDALPMARRQLIEIGSEATSLNDAENDWQLLFNQGLVAQVSGESEAAIQNFRAAIARLDQVRAGVSGAGGRQSLMSSKVAQDLYDHLIAMLIAAHREGEAWEYLERDKARAFQEMLNGRKFRAPVRDTPQMASLRDLESKIAGLRAEVTPASEQILRGAGRDPGALRAELQRLEVRFTAAREEIEVGSSRSGQVLALKPLSLDRISQTLPVRTALIEYGVGNDSTYAFVVTKSGAKLRSWKIKRAELARKVSSLRSYLVNPNSGETLEAPLADVSRMVIQPVADDIPADVNQLIIVPAAQLYYLPFQVLRLPDGQAMIDRFSIRYLPNAGALQFLKSSSGKSGKLFLGALGSASVEGMAPLPGTLKETEAIAKVMPGATLVSGSGFTHDRARSALLEFDDVHFATHGIVDADAPLFSALLTSPSPGQTSRLPLYELMNLNLRASLVVLSACETGLGKLTGGDEIAGLTRTLLTAGASTVISSLWKVSDDSTALLMENFYRGLRVGKPATDAMRDASLIVRKQYPEPFYWAPFIVTGAR